MTERLSKPKLPTGKTAGEMLGVRKILKATQKLAKAFLAKGKNYCFRT